MTTNFTVTDVGEVVTSRAFDPIEAARLSRAADVAVAPRPKLVFIGHSGAGKDEAGAWLAAHTQLRFAHATSWYLAPYVAARTGLPVATYRGPGRHEHKELMYLVGREIRAVDPGVLVREQAVDNDVLVGCRDPEELEYARESGLVDLAVWLDRDVPVDPTMRRFGGRPWLHADVRLDNTGTLDRLHRRLATLARALGLPVN